jgi:signal transduction histidine kinase
MRHSSAAVADVIELPVRREDDGQLEHDLLYALSTADDLVAGMAGVVDSIRSATGAAGVEWWAGGEDGLPELVAAAGAPGGRRENLPLGRADVLVLHGGRLDPQIESALTSLTPIVRRRASEERLARTAVQLARRNQALEDFAALVAHELKTPLHVALVAEDPSGPLEDALDLVDTLLEAAQGESDERVFSSVAESLGHVVEDLGADVEISADLATTLPLPPGPLRVILRNLLANAVAAGARHVDVTAARTRRSWRLQLDDDGVGLADLDRYAAGSGLGLSLCRRIASRFGGVLELTPRPTGGTRVTLEFAEALA